MIVKATAAGTPEFYTSHDVGKAGNPDAQKKLPCKHCKAPPSNTETQSGDVASTASKTGRGGAPLPPGETAPPHFYLHWTSRSMVPLANDDTLYQNTNPSVPNIEDDGFLLTLCSKIQKSDLAGFSLAQTVLRLNLWIPNGVLENDHPAKFTSRMSD